MTQPPVVVVQPPEPLEVHGFQFRLHRSVRVFEDRPDEPLPPNKSSLVASAPRFGLVFVGSPDGNLHVFSVSDLVRGTGDRCPRIRVPLASAPVHLAVNCEGRLLSVALSKNGSLFVLVYDIAGLFRAAPKEIRIGVAPDVRLCALEWNPCLPDSLAACVSDGTLSVFRCRPDSDSVECRSERTEARCVSWSPKGKQLVAGNSDGTVTQYKPDLTVAKTVPAPVLYRGGTDRVSAVAWISTYQFVIVYNDTCNGESRSCVTVMNAPKSGTPDCVNYDDICYSSETFREVHFYLLQIPQWGVVLASSANSMEIGVLGTSDQQNWQQWIQPDEARAELPLNDDKMENYPVGICLDNSATVRLPVGENATLPHMPMIHVLSHTGMLVTFFVINTLPGAAEVCSVPERLALPEHLKTEDTSEKGARDDFSFDIPKPSVTSTPVPVCAKPQVPKELGDDTSFIPPELDLTALNKLPQPTRPNPIATAPSNVNTANLLKEQIKVPPSQPAPEKKTVPSKETSDPPPASMQNYEKVINSVLLKEVNNFQHELYDLLDKCRGIDTEIGTDEEMNRLSTILSESKSPLRSIWSEERLKNQITVLKHNLINTCAFLAQAKMQPESDELEQLAQLDPVSIDKMSSIKSSTYYVESQLEQINRALNEQWQIFEEECRKKAIALKGINDEDYMKMPTLDKIYQPLLKQSEILCKQYAIVASLEKSVASMELPKKSLLQDSFLSNDASNNSTAISNLSKSLINMNIQTNANASKKESNRAYKNMSAKYSSLKKLLKNHKTAVIKPARVEPVSITDVYSNWKSDESNGVTEEKAPSKTITENKSFDVTFDKVKPSMPEPNALFSLNNSVSKLPKDTTKIDVEPKPVQPGSNFISISTASAVQPKQTTEKPSLVETFNSKPYIPNIPTPSSLAESPPVVSVTRSEPFSFANLLPKVSTAATPKTTSSFGFQNSTFTLVPNTNKPLSAQTDLPPKSVDGHVNNVSLPVRAPSQVSIEKTPSSNNLFAFKTTTSSTGSIFGGSSIFLPKDGNTIFKSQSLTVAVVEPKSVGSTDTNNKNSVFPSNTDTDTDTQGDTKKSNENQPNINQNLTKTTTDSFDTQKPIAAAPVNLSVKEESINFTLPTLTADTVAEEKRTPETSSPNTFKFELDSTTSDFGFESLSTAATGVFTPPTEPNKTTSAPADAFGGVSFPGANEKLTTPVTTNIFGQTPSVNTCASSLFGAANAAIDTSPPSIFGGVSVPSGTDESVFGNPTTTTSGSIFGGFGSSLSFGTAPSNNIFGSAVNQTGTFGQPSNTGNIFGGSSTFGNANASPSSGNIFKGPQTSSVFGTPVSTPTNIFGGNVANKSPFGSPAAPAAPMFGSPAVSTPSAPVFGGSPTFGSKPVFGQPASFGSPATSFGMFSGGNEQQSVAQGGFGSPSAFGISKPNVFGGSEFGSAPSFNSSPFGGGSSPFASPLGMQQPAFGMGNQQSSTFESLATQSGLSFGNLAQQSSQSPPPSQPVFQGSSSFSTWRS